MADGAIVGIVTNSAKVPVAGATVTAVKSNGGGIRATISGSDGVYSFADVPAGSWVITVHVDGEPDAVAAALEVIAGKATRKDLVMNVPRSPASGTVGGGSRTRRGGGRGGERGGLRNGGRAAPRPGGADACPRRCRRRDPAPENDTVTPFANVGDIGWMNGTTREKSPIFDTKFFTPEIRLDVNYLQSLNHPIDHTIDGSTEEFRSGEFQIEQVSFGGDFHWNNVQARFLLDVRHVRHDHAAQ